LGIDLKGEEKGVGDCMGEDITKKYDKGQFAGVRATKVKAKDNTVPKKGG